MRAFDHATLDATASGLADRRRWYGGCVQFVARVKEAATRVKDRPAVAAALAVHQRVSELGGSFLAAAVTLRMFLSLFPMLLLAVAVVGFLSAGDDTLASEIVSDLGLTGDVAELVTESLAAAEDNRAGTSLAGLIGLVWTSLGLVDAIAHVCSRAWQLPSRGLIGKLFALGWLLGALVLLGGSIVLTALLNVLPGWLAPLQIIASVALLVGFFLFTFWLLTPRPLPLSAHLPGAVLAGVGGQLLTLLAALVVPRQAASSSALYGSVGVVFGLLVWLLLFGRLVVYAVAFNVVRYENRHGTVPVEVEVPDLDGVAQVAADRSAVVRQPD